MGMNETPTRRNTAREGREPKGGTMSDITTITPTALAETLGVDPKALRTYLRREHTRAVEAKNTSWAITPEVVEAATAHFEAKKAAKATPPAAS